MSHTELHYQTLSIRFQAGRSLSVKSGYYADWIITERNASDARKCGHCRNYCSHGYEHATESCTSSCRCVTTADTGVCRFVSLYFPLYFLRLFFWSENGK